MNFFWREEPATEQESKLLALLFKAHEESSFRNNVSSVVLQQVAGGSGSYTNGIAAAILSLGGVHAPLEDIHEVLTDEVLPTAGIVPGWGNSFIKGVPDSAWAEVGAQISVMAPNLALRITSITDALYARGKLVFPNPGCYTAAVAIILGIPKQIAAYLFISARLSPWTYMAMNQLAPKPQFQT